MPSRSSAVVVLFVGCLLSALIVNSVAAQTIRPLCVSGCIPDYGVTVTPDGTNAGNKVLNTVGYTAVFALRNTGALADTYNLTCAGNVLTTCTSISPSTASLGGGGSTNVTVTYSVGGTLGAGKVRLSARSPDTDFGDTGYYTLTVTGTYPPGAPVLASLPRNRPDQLERGLCLTAGAGEAAWQCGDLIVSHAMPAYTTLGRNRSLTLVYNSATAAPRPTAAVTVTEPSGVSAPPNVVAELWVGPSGSQVLRASGTYGTWTGAPATRQIALSDDASADTTGIYDYTGGEEQLRHGPLGVDAGQADRGQSRDLPLLWVGGDGSARIYAQLSATTWLGPTAAYQDTLTKAGTPAVYTRTLRHGVKVLYDAARRHITTTTRVLQSTTFAWGGLAGDSLMSIRVPPDSISPASPGGGTYQIVYDNTTSGKVDRLRDPGPNGGRTLDLTVNTSTGQLMGIVDPDTKGVSFGYDPTTKVMTSRTNRQGYPTSFFYTANLKVDSVSVPYGVNGSSFAGTAYQPWDTLIKGPRNVADDTKFYVDRWGAPSKTIDPMGATTWIERTQNKYPALVTRVTYPNNRIVRMYYDSTGTTCCRGNLVEVRDSTFHLDSRATRVTTYAYAAAGTPDGPTETRDALGRKTVYTYTGLGLVDSTIDPRGHAAKFLYDSLPGALLRGTITQVVESQIDTWNETAGRGDE